MAPKDMNNKVFALRRQDESPEPIGSVEEYPIAQLKAAVVGVTHRVTREKVYQVAKTII